MISVNFMGSHAYNNPSYGLPSDAGGSFIGIGRFDAACNVPNEMQPGVPPGGLFGPDAGLTPWGFPGYFPNTGIDFPWLPFMPAPDGLIPDLPGVNLSSLPGTRPIAGMPSGGKVVMDNSEFMAQITAGAYVSMFGMSRVHFPQSTPVESESKGEPDEGAKEETGESGGGFWNWLGNTFKNWGRRIGGPLGLALKAVGSIAKPLGQAAFAIGKAVGRAVGSIIGAYSAVTGAVRNVVDHGMRAFFYGVMSRNWSTCWADTRMSDVEENNMEGTPFVRGCRFAEFGLGLILIGLTGLRAAGVTGPSLKIGLSRIPKSAVKLGEWGEKKLSLYLKGAGYKPKKPFRTSLGYRLPDRIVDGIAHESKAGLNVKLTSSLEKQILKDAELVQIGRIRGAHWHFWRGAHKSILEFLNEHGISYTVH